MRARLAGSVEVIAEAVRECGGRLPEDLHEALAKVRARPANPALFAIYHDLAVAAGTDDLEGTVALLQVFSRRAAEGGDGTGIVALRDEDLGGQAARYIRMVDDDASSDVSLHPVDAGTAAAMRVRIAEALSLIRAADPELAGEIDVLGRQIVLAEGDAGRLKFSGASTFFLWGALVINPRTNADALTLAETLAHESGHALLFGLSDAEPLTHNSADERFRSPLRVDPRPMEGIVHATYVLARMARALDAIAERSPLPAGERARAKRMADASRAYCLDGLKVVRGDARFTERGRMLFEAGVAA